MAENISSEKIKRMSTAEKKKLIKKIGQDASDWELTWGG